MGIFRESGNNCASEETNCLQGAISVKKVSFKFMPSAEIKQEIPFSSSILHK